MAEVVRITPQETRDKVLSGKTMLICAYTDDAKFEQYHLDGALSISAFQARFVNLTKDQELIFY